MEQKNKKIAENLENIEKDKGIKQIVEELEGKVVNPTILSSESS